MSAHRRYTHTRIGSPFRACLLPGVLAALVTLLSACATGQHPQVPVLAMPSRYGAAEQPSLPPAVLDSWWRLYGDAQLRTLVERALSQGLDARVALARLDEARAIRGQALSRFAPQGGLQGTFEHTRSDNLDDSITPGETEAGNLSLPISWELDLFGRRAAARQAADADLAAARFQYEAARAAVAAQVAQTLFQARGFAALLEDAHANERIQLQLLSLLERRVARGLAAAADSDRVAAELANSRAQRLALEAQWHASRRALLVLLGEGLAPIETMMPGQALPSPPDVPTGAPSELLLRRPDIRETLARISGAEGAVRLAERDFFPTVTLRPSVGITRQRGLLDSTQSFWTLGAGLAVPVLDRPLLMAALDLQGARAQQAVANYEGSVQTAFAEVDQSLVQLARARERAEVLEEGVRRAQRAFDAAQVRYQRGLADLQVLLDTEAAWRATRTAHTTARREALEASVQTFKALGGGWPASPSPAVP
jgi:outer membrane protein, multidrug efflux system